MDRQIDRQTHIYPQAERCSHEFLSMRLCESVRNALCVVTQFAEKHRPNMPVYLLFWYIRSCMGLFVAVLYRIMYMSICPCVRKILASFRLLLCYKASLCAVVPHSFTYMSVCFPNNFQSGYCATTTIEKYNLRNLTLVREWCAGKYTATWY